MAKRVMLVAAAFIFNFAGFTQLSGVTKDLNRLVGISSPIKLYNEWKEYKCGSKTSFVDPLFHTLDSLNTWVSISIKHEIVNLGVYTTPFGIGVLAFNIISNSKNVYDGAVNLSSYKNKSENLKNRVIIKLEKWHPERAKNFAEQRYFSAKRLKWETKLSRWDKFKLISLINSIAKNVNLIAFSVLGLTAALTVTPLVVPILVVGVMATALKVFGIILSLSMKSFPVKPERYGLDKDFLPSEKKVISLLLVESLLQKNQNKKLKLKVE